MVGSSSIVDKEITDKKGLNSSDMCRMGGCGSSRKVEEV
jgi:hypothetical protein